MRSPSRAPAFRLGTNQPTVHRPTRLQWRRPAALCTRYVHNAPVQHHIIPRYSDEWYRLSVVLSGPTYPAASHSRLFVSGDDMPDPSRRAVAHEQEQAPLADGIARRADVSPTRYAVAGTPCVRVVAKLLDAVTAGRQQPLQCVSAQRSCLWNMKRSLCSS